MIFSSGTKYRSIYSQNILSYNIDLNINNTNGISSFGFSGDSGNLNLFTFTSGKVYDVNNRHVWSYNPSENIFISGNINTGDSNYYINNNIICLSSPKENNHFYKYFYVNTRNCEINLNSYIYGNNTPNYFITFPFENLIGDNITGYIYNNASNSNFSFQIFSGQLTSQNFYSLTGLPVNFISGNRSGNIIFNYSSTVDPSFFSSGIVQLDFLGGFLSLQTNFGNITYDLTNTPIKPRPFYYIDFIEILTGIFEDLYYNYNYIYELRTNSPIDQSVFISLSNYTGHTGDLYYTEFLLTGKSSGKISGFVYGEDYITGIVNGFGVSVDLDYFNQYITGNVDFLKTGIQLATGFFDYFYNIPVGGGSGLASGIPGLSIEATGFVNKNISEFVYKNRQFTGMVSGLLTGYWGNLIQTGTGFIKMNEDNGVFYSFTGQNFINYSNFLWNGIPYLGYEIENFYNQNKIYGITGSGQINFTTLDSGVNTEKNRIFTQQSTGILIKNIINLSPEVISNNISGDVFGSEDVPNLIYVFGNESAIQWGTDPSISTGFLGFEFKNFSAYDSGIISYYEIDLNKDFSNYKFIPQNFKLQGSNLISGGFETTGWLDMDSRSNVNFYEPYTNIFQVTGTGNYNFVRLIINSGIKLPHLNNSTLDNYEYGLSINKINFYKSLNIVTGLYENLIDNNQNSNLFISSKNSGDPIYLGTTVGVGGYQNNYLFSKLNIINDWSSINTSLNGRVQVGTTNNSYVYVSRNSGTTWNTGIFLKKDWRDSAISFDGSLITTLAYNDKIYISYDSGVNWKNNFDNTNTWKAIDASYDGKYQIALSESQIFTSNNSGINWSEVPLENLPGTINGIFQDVAISKTGRFVLAATSATLLYSKNTGIYWFDYNEVSPNIADRYWKGVALSSDGQIWGGVAYKEEDSELTDKVWINNKAGLSSNWTGISFYTGGLDNSTNGKLNSINFSFDGRVQAVSLELTECTNFPCAGLSFTSDGGIYTSLDTGNSWQRAFTINTGTLLENFVDVSVTSGGNQFFAITKKQNDYLFSNDFGNIDLWQSTQLDKDAYSYIQLTGKNIGYKTCKAYYNNILTGFYISFVSGYAPSSLLTVDVSASGDNYLELYRKTGSISLTESGLLKGVTISDPTGYKYFRFQFDTGKYGLHSISPVNCYSGWEQNTSYVNSWRSLAMTKNGRVQYGVGISGVGIDSILTYTGFLYRSVDYGNNWSMLTAIIGDDINKAPIEQVQLNSISIDKNTGRYALISRDGGAYNVISAPSTSDYKIYLSTNSGNSFSSVGNDGAWLNTAMSNDAKIMIAVGLYDFSSYPTNAQISYDFGSNWTDISNKFVDKNLNSIAMSSGGNIIYITESTGIINRSFDSGQNWDEVSPILTSVEWKSISTSYNGQYITAVTNDDKDVFVSSDYGNNWINVLKNNYDYTDVAISSGGQYQLVTSLNNKCFRSENFGISWYEITGLNILTSKYLSCDMSADGSYQNVGQEEGFICNNCTYGNDIPPPVPIRIKNINFYLKNQKNFFYHDLGNITGYGIILANAFGTGTGLLYNPTGRIYQPAISYQTGRVTGIVSDGDSSFFIPELAVGGTGISNQVFLDIITGTRQATGIILFNTGLLSELDYISINNTNFSYVTGDPTNNYEFNNISGLINILNSGATGAFDDNTLETVVGVTGYVLPSQDGLVLFSYYNSGENGNNTKLARSINNINAITIPHRYFQGGQSLRPALNNWTGTFTGDFFTLYIENSGFYTIDFQGEDFSSTISGVVFENNFDKNWSININPVSETSPLDTGLGINVLYNNSTKIFSGLFYIKSGLPYLGYSGLNLNFNKRSFNNLNNTGNFARYLISGNKFLYTGILKG